ncbi:MAG: hypothetical protein M3X11_05185 [Acidobacteriota bacterium]|nr:hypothetical protein [Acidobacteriota bacterium]
MRRSTIVSAVLLLLSSLAVSAMAQNTLEGQWVGKVKSPRGERDANATFKKAGDNYTGTISGFQPGQEVPLKNIKVDGDKVTAVAEVETPQAAITINYKFTLAGDTLNGQGSADFNGNAINFDLELKRGGSASAATSSGAATGSAPQDKLAGRWAGKIKSMQGEADANASFTKEGDKYSGTVSGMRPGQNIPLKNIKVEGNKVTAVAEVETPQAALVINYSFTIKGDTLNGTGALDFNGNAFTFDLDLKRADGTAPAAAAGSPSTPSARPARSGPEQPQQKQSIDYFVGKWNFRVVGRESALAPSPREGTVTFTKRADGKSVEGVVEGTADGKPYRDTIILAFDEASKMLTVTEKLASGAQISGRGDWSSPISIRFTVDPVKIKRQSLQLRRTLSIVAAHSFTVTEELSEDGGSFVRLGNAVYSRAQ